jgi:hypothetical protein
MNAQIIKLLTSFLLMPLLAILFTFIAYLISKKSKLFSNKRSIFYVLLVGLLLSVPGLLGFLDYEFMPYYYIALVILYLILGWANIGWLRMVVPDIRKDRSYVFEFFVHFVIMLIGAGFFSMIFNFCNELQYGLWACTCVLPFIFPSLFYETYLKYMEIPLEIHKIWKFSANEDLSDFDYMDYNKLTVMELEFFKQVQDKTPTKVKAKTPDNMPFGTWFHKFIVDYNLKFPLTPIELRDNEGEFGWIFYVKRSFFLPRKYVDFELSVIQNKIKETYTIVAKRVVKEPGNAENDKNENEIEQK